MSAGCFIPHALGQSVVGYLYAVVVIIPVHGVVAPRQAGHLTDPQLPHLALQLVHIVDAALGRSIAPVQEAVHIYLLQAVPLSQLQQPVNVSDVAVYAAVRDQAVEVQGRVLLFAVVDSGHQALIGEEITVLYGLGDPGQLLIHDAPGAHVHVSHLGVAHLPVRESHSEPRRVALDEGVLLLQPVYVGRIGHGHGIGHGVVVQPEAVQYQQHCRFIATHCSTFLSSSLILSIIPGG